MECRSHRVIIYNLVDSFLSIIHSPCSLRLFFNPFKLSARSMTCVCMCVLMWIKNHLKSE